nr:unnamed protein product [Digitaria exilis]
MAAAAALKFTVRRRPVVLVSPAAPTPREWKRLSDIDDQDGLRFHMPAVYFYPRHDVSIVVGGQQDPAPVISDAIARALVHYYPLAGRLRELQGRKLAVDCTGQGVLFVEADADVRLEHFGKALQPPFPCMEKLLFDVPGSSETLNSPLLFFQVTRLACGGFILATRMQHAVMDAQGFVQFLGGVAELARGALAPKVRPVWTRELLEARHPPRPSFAHREYDNDVRAPRRVPLEEPDHGSDDTTGGRQRGDAAHLHHLVFGLGQPVYGGPAMGGVGAIPRVSSFLVKGKNAMDEDGVVAPVCLPAPAMDRFAEEIRKLLRSPVVVDVPAPQQAGVVPLVMSAL